MSKVNPRFVVQQTEITDDAKVEHDPATLEPKRDFPRELASLLNRHCIENNSNTPDFLLAEYLIGCLESYQKITNQREKWYGLKLHPARFGGPVEYLDLLLRDSPNRSQAV